MLDPLLLDDIAALVREAGPAPETVACPVDPAAARALAERLGAEAREGQASLVLCLEALERGVEGLAVQRDLGERHLVVLPLDRAALVGALPEAPRRGLRDPVDLARRVLEEAGYRVERLQPWPARSVAGAGRVRGALRRTLGRGEEVLALCRPYDGHQSLQSPCGRWGYQPSDDEAITLPRSALDPRSLE